MYESLTKYLPELNKDKFGEWVFDDKNDGSPEHPMHFPFVNYDDIVGEIWQAIYDTVDQHPELEIVKWYNELKKKTKSIRNFLML